MRPAGQTHPVPRGAAEPSRPWQAVIGEDVKEILLCDLKLEMAAHPLYDAAIEHCESVRDFVTRELLVHIQKSEEEHIDFIEEQLGLIDRWTAKLHSIGHRRVNDGA